MIGLSRAPEIDRPGLMWLNSPSPLSLKSLRGRLVILDFWTFCCINCMHVLPTLHQVEDAFPGLVQVIGVHSPKFPAEHDSATVRAAIDRYQIRHPVIHDPDMQLWQEYAVRAWPTLVLVSPDGYVIGQVSGEPDPERLIQGLGAILHGFVERGEIIPADLLPFPVEDAPTLDGALAFPGKIKPLPVPPAFASGARWAVADAGHHQIVLLDQEGAVCARLGSGQAALQDGTMGEGCFRSPQGLVADSHALYVADTGNHALRRIDLADGTISTLAGNGRRGGVIRAGEQVAVGDRLELASPWDVEIVASTGSLLGAGPLLYVANAGTHQLLGVQVQPDGGVQVMAVVGTGGENIVDGPVETALLAQPSGLVLDWQRGILWFADSETSALRGLTLEADADKQQVFTMIGRGLFEFGHRDGETRQAQLQHPLGLCLLPDEQPDQLASLLVADSYNAVLRHVIPHQQQVSTLDLGQCLDPLCRPLGEPAGVWAENARRVLISDTNNHRIVSVDLAAGVYRVFCQ
ncbi:thioredoxin-like domain-containing protein [Insolitispirillum peregrinum]|uniref:thioredoxin-like domain-containing protein n=1 Tax=Insolitispirillum peregrinum TaxID=80876 RepID=UPI00360F4FAE